MTRISLALGAALVSVLACQKAPRQEPAAAGPAADSAPAGPAVDTPEWKIAAFTSAAPPEIGAAAAVMDWPDSTGGPMRQLRAGTNGWTCMPSTAVPAGVTTPAAAGPMCLDSIWMNWAAAWMSRTPPKVSGVGIGYMLKGDQGASNTNPFATGPTPDNAWVVAGPHIMVLTPNAAQIAALPTDPKTGGPWVMWKGTPYAHVMVPVAAGTQ